VAIEIDLRVVEENMKLFFFATKPGLAGRVVLDDAKIIPQKLLSSCLDGGQIRKVKFEEYSFLPCSLFEILDGLFRFFLASSCNIDFCIVRQQSLHERER